MSGAIYKCYNKQPFVTSESLLLYIWMSGLLIGIVLTLFCGDYCYSLFGTFLFSTGIHERVLFAILPFLLSALAVTFLHPAWLYLICGLKATIFMVCCLTLCMKFGQAGWIARWLFMFTDACSAPIFLFYCLRNVSNCRRKCWYEYTLLLVFLIGILIVDYRIVSPYAAKFGFF